MVELVQAYSKELTLIMLTILILGTLIILVPQLLKWHIRKMEILHVENMKSLENGVRLPISDERATIASRMALLVPMVVMLGAATVTCFLAIYNSTQIFPVSLGVFVIAGVVSLAAITGGVALVSRLAHLEDIDAAEEESEAAERTYRS
ncbi:MAG: hypothetical protein K2X38_01195 [Gemmataceae bacterium]|nr:hypothetical protein [Gemmataceae bacterium]